MNALLCLTLVSMATIASALFTSPCPIGCADRTCFGSFGCRNCNRGLCMKFVSSGARYVSLCVPDCGEGMFCTATTSLGPFCTACLVDNCSRCSERYKCNACKWGYQLKKSSFRDSCERNLYG